MNPVRIARLLILASAFQSLVVLAAIIPREVGQWPSPAGLTASYDYFTGAMRGVVQTDMAIRGDKAFVGVRVAAQTSYLVIFDLAQGPNPVKLSQLELSPSNSVHNIAVNGNIACVGGRSNPGAIDVIDISDLAHPKLAGVVFHPASYTPQASVAANQNVAYIHGQASQFMVVDLSNPSLPQIIRTLPYYFAEFLVDGTRGFGIGAGGLEIFDLTDPTNPVLIGGSTAIRGLRIVVSGSVAFVGAWNLLSVDLHDPAAPKIISSISYNNAVPSPVAKLGNLLATSFGALYDVSNPTNLSVVGVVGNMGSPVAIRAAADHFVTFMADNGLRVIDTANPKNPTTLGFYPLGSARPHTRPGDPHVYFTFSRLGLVIVDFSDISNPVVVGRCDLPPAPDRIAFKGNIAYVFQSFGVTLVDISDPKNPIVTRTFDSFDLESPEFPGAATFHNDRLYAHNDYLLKVYDAADPNALPLVDTIFDVFCYQIHGSLLFTSDIPETLRVWDISDSSNRTLIAEYPGYGGTSMAITSSRLIVSGSAFRVFDISLDGKLTLVEKFSPAYGSLAALGSTVVSIGTSEICVFEIPETGQPRRSSVSAVNLPGVDDAFFFGTSLFAHSVFLGTRIFDFDTRSGPTIVNPIRGAAYNSGQTIPITWTSAADSNDWAVSLYAPPGFSRTEIPIAGAIAQSSENIFQLDWQIPDHLETWSAADTYQVLVRDKNSGAQAFSDRFTIIDHPKLSYSDQRYDSPPGIYLSWPSRFDDSYILSSKESLDAEWKPETLSDGDLRNSYSVHAIQGDALAQPQKFFNLLPKVP